MQAKLCTSWGEYQKWNYLKSEIWYYEELEYSLCDTMATTLSSVLEYYDNIDVSIICNLELISGPHHALSLPMHYILVLWRARLTLS